MMMVVNGDNDDKDKFFTDHGSVVCNDLLCCLW